MAKSSRFARSKECAGVPAAVGSCNPRLLISSKNPETDEEMSRKLRFLKIEVVDDTALIDTSLISNSKGKTFNNRRQETMKKGPPTRKDWKIKKIKKSYSRAEMLALSLHNLHHQRNMWSQVYGSLAASVAAEYDGLLAASAFYRRPIFFDGGATAMGKRSPLKISVH